MAKKTGETPSKNCGGTPRENGGGVPKRGNISTESGGCLLRVLEMNKWGPCTIKRGNEIILTLKNADFPAVVNRLMIEKEEDPNSYAIFNGKIINENTVNKCYKQYYGEEREVVEKKRQEEEHEKKQRYAKKIAASREGKEVTITMDKVISGLKFIVENPDMEQEEFIDNLIALGCNFTLDDVKKQFKSDDLAEKLMKEGDIRFGAQVIFNSMANEWGRERCYQYHINDICYFISKVTGKPYSFPKHSE